ncbi:MAG: hypothetical protein DDG59_15005 [Anaerolineae bacterium]|jgi:hypothetical protein|nr:MAG: hypothetical protein DDG59_15005 [Anaerolineae bacterium]
MYAKARFSLFLLSFALLACRAELGILPTPTVTPLPPTQTPTPSPTVTFTPTLTATLPEPSATPTATTLASSPTDSWNTYRNYNFGFELRYPPGSSFSVNLPNTARLELPFESGTNLVEKYVEINAQEYFGRCLSPLMESLPPEALQLETLVVEPLTFERISYSEGAAGSRYDWTAYAVHNDTTCVTFDFVLHSSNPDNFPTPPPTFNAEIEQRVFEQIVQTFVWFVP